MLYNKVFTLDIWRGQYKGGSGPSLMGLYEGIMLLACLHYLVDQTLDVWNALLPPVL